MANQRARTLRFNQTDAEKALWKKLRALRAEGFHFRRQAPIGKYVADFACQSGDRGRRHNEEDGLARDAERTTWLEGEGYKVLRFWNNDVLTNIEGVEETIRRELGLI